MVILQDSLAYCVRNEKCDWFEFTETFRSEVYVIPCDSGFTAGLVH